MLTYQRCSREEPKLIPVSGSVFTTDSPICIKLYIRTLAYTPTVAFLSFSQTKDYLY